MNTKIMMYALIIVVIVLGAFYFFSLPQKAAAPVVQEPTQTTTTTTTTTSTSTTAATPATTAVSVINFSFNPATLTINKGDTVVWTNNDAVPHQIAGAPLQGPVMSKGQTYAFTFNTAGTFNYHCAIHPSMKGTIVVK